MHGWSDIDPRYSTIRKSFELIVSDAYTKTKYSTTHSTHFINGYFGVGNILFEQTPVAHWRGSIRLGREM